MFGKIVFLALLTITPSICASNREGKELLGTQAPALGLVHWLNTSPVETAGLRGKVVLVRWWTDTCPFCAATAPALCQLQDKYGPRGLQVIGIFHPKPSGDWSIDRMQRAATRFQFTFPIGLDGDWAALKRWWLDGARREYTSVSFILDRHGVIRYIHPGGEFHEGTCTPGQPNCESDFRAIEKTIEDLLDSH